MKLFAPIGSRLAIAIDVVLFVLNAMFAAQDWVKGSALWLFWFFFVLFWGFWALIDIDHWFEHRQIKTAITARLEGIHRVRTQEGEDRPQDPADPHHGAGSSGGHAG